MFWSSNFFGFHKGIEKMMMINEVNTMTTRQNDLVVKKSHTSKLIIAELIFKGDLKLPKLT